MSQRIAVRLVPVKIHDAMNLAISKAREKLVDILEESKSEEVVIRRRKGDLYSIVPKLHPRRSPFDVAGLQKGLSRKEILEAIRESRERPNKSLRRAR